MAIDLNIDKKAMKSGFWYAISNIAIRSISIITIPIFTRLLSPSAFGIASNYSAWQNVILILSGLCMTYSIGVAFIDFPGRIDEYISSIQTLGTIVSGILLITAVIFSEYFGSIMKLDGYLVIFMCSYLVLSPSVAFAQIKYRYTYAYKKSVAISLINATGIVILSIALLLLLHERQYLGRIFGFSIPMMIIGAYMYYGIAKAGKVYINSTYWKYALKLSLPMIPHAISMIMLDQMDRIQLGQMRNMAEVGIYSLGYSYALLLGVFSIAISQAWLPWLYEKYRKSEISDIHMSNQQILSFMCMITLVFIALAPEALLILGTRGYWDARWIVPPVAVATLAQYIYSNYSSLEMYHKKTVYIAVFSVLAASLVFFLNIALIPRYGFIAAGYTTLAGYFLLMLLHNIGYRMITKIDVYNDSRTYLKLAVTMIFAAGLTAIYNYPVIRFAILGIGVILFLFIMRQSLLDVFKGIGFEKMFSKKPY